MVKTTNIYKNAFFDLLDKMGISNLTFALRIMYADFEQTVHSAVL